VIRLGLTGQLTLATTIGHSYFLSLWERIEVRAAWSPALTPTSPASRLLKHDSECFESLSMTGKSTMRSSLLRSS